MALAYTLHILFAVIWVGGMFFSQMALRPVVVAQLEAPQRLQLLTAVLGRFFWSVWAAVIILPVTGFWLIASYGGMGNLGWHIHMMTALGMVMVLIYLVLYFVIFLRLRRAVTAQNFPAAGRQVVWVQRLVWTNLLLGVLIILTTAFGARGGF
ncbi:MAG: hypothetical protein CSA09_00030 [Candidatus Contendobacter odensis]|uniref:Copper resistance protein D domain-containing protein n=1 Tax=Candidatus Contendibacter odensensis TaxID=1400860 RepID=A0A2G6PGP7_9GAMM|nr:MAG: hypothetical protein CSA09_00030 [Candidatus Contendobacter odensis]